jgi:ribosomal subunit interface protein
MRRHNLVGYVGEHDPCKDSVWRPSMQTPLQLTFRSVEHSDSLALHVSHRSEKLERFFDRIISCHVVVELAGHHRSRGDPFRITVNLGLPGHEIVVSHAPPEGRILDDARETADRAFDEVERQLEDWVKRQREERHESPRKT